MRREPEYREADAKWNFWTGWAVSGTIHAKVCEDCGRILFYAEPKPEG